MNATFLPSIEKPEGLMMKLVYYFTRRRFGKVLTPLKVHAVRLPLAFGRFYGKVSQLDKKLSLPPESVLLIREQVARINVCLFCQDIARSIAIKASMDQAKLDALEQYQTSDLFTEGERAALDYVTELTQDNHVSPDMFARLRTTIPSARSAKLSGSWPASTSTTSPTSVSTSTPTCSATSTGKRRR